MAIPWAERWYQDVPQVLQKTKAYYQDQEKDLWKVTGKQVLQLREWVDIDPRLLVEQLELLNIVYVPAAMEPGPMVVFPEFDLEGIPSRAQTKPLYKLLGDSKYVTLGVKQEEFKGPVWLGNQVSTLEQIIKSQQVVVCEGPFDLLALRLAAPEVPSLCSLTKRVSEPHIDYLRLLGVNTLHLMYDNETSGYGENSMKEIQKEFGHFINIQQLSCPVGDPSECLKTKPQTRNLRSILNSL
jgi:hypothetical protein